MEKIFISSERFEEFQWDFQERCKGVAYDYIKSQTKPGLHLLPKRYILEKTQE